VTIELIHEQAEKIAREVTRRRARAGNEAYREAFETARETVIDLELGALGQRRYGCGREVPGKSKNPTSHGL
jgi:hypothetical protein